jgi:hypothetical protein
MRVFDFSSGFRNQADMWTHLLGGGKVKSLLDGSVWELENGNLGSYYPAGTAFIWVKYEEPNPEPA